MRPGFRCPEKGAFGIQRCSAARHGGKQDLGKSHPAERQEVVPDRDRSSYSLSPCFRACSNAGGYFPIQNDIGIAQSPARPQYAEDFSE